MEYSSLKIQTENVDTKTDIDNKKVNTDSKKPSIFTINKFVDNVRIMSIDRNRKYLDESHSINAYDIAKECIRKVVFRLTNQQVEILPNMWLPSELKSVIGNAIHEFIQNNFEFSEVEVSVKVPSIRVSGRIDAIINDNVLVEIKSCQLRQYLNIVKSSTPRRSDLIQTIFYRYILHNYLEEIKNSNVTTRTSIPKRDKYNIDLIQIIYVANDIFSSDFDSEDEILEYYENVKRVFDSKNNQFYFIACMNIDVNSVAVSKFEEYIEKKINRINYYISSNKIPPLNDDFINKKDCYFCMYKGICK
ncbi:MAG: PD-(D/E)XK nuclease family protein [Candidatus Anstonellales archaeon]